MPGPETHLSADSSTENGLPNHSSVQVTPSDTNLPANSLAPSTTTTVNQNDSASITTLVPPPDTLREGRRQLLLIYIHGFMGAEDSFKVFPAHVHNLVTSSLQDSHVVYSKIYPRYKSRRSIDIARNDFSNWLSPHETETTDIILLGHSMGGIVGAEVALLSAPDNQQVDALKHRILGLINFDVPFLGMHPGVVSAGLGSLFQPKDRKSPKNSASDSTDQDTGKLGHDGKSDSSNSSFLEPLNNPNFDPAFHNDKRSPQRTQWEGALRFFKKNSDRITQAARDYVSSYFEFGGSLADYSGLQRRYRRLIELEELDEYKLHWSDDGRQLRRLRFVNYYTASTGFPKPDPASKESNQIHPETVQQPYSGRAGDSVVSTEQDSDSLRRLNSATTSLASRTTSNPESSSSGPESPSPSTLQDEPSIATMLESLPPLPSIPEEPAEFDPSSYHDKDTLKLAQKEHARLVKSYERSKKEHEQAIKEREKLVKKKLEQASAKNKAETSTAQEADYGAEVTQSSTLNRAIDTPMERYLSTAAENDEASQPLLKESGPPPLPPRDISIASIAPPQDPEDDTEGNVISQRMSSLNIHARSPSPAETTQTRTTTNTVTITDATTETSMSTTSSIIGQQPKKRKDRKFCSLPPKNSKGERDARWVRIFMEGIDEVVAHQSMFLPNDASYARLVGDTAARIEQWVQDDCTRRFILESEGNY